MYKLQKCVGVIIRITSKEVVKDFYIHVLTLLFVLHHPKDKLLLQFIILKNPSYDHFKSIVLLP
jgi:hypothetical protein